MSIRRSLLFLCLLSASAWAQNSNLGIFTHSEDIGSPAPEGTGEFSQGQYRITGSGVNIWGKQDQFHYVWREMTGNFTVTATLHFLGEGTEHRKAGIMVRQSPEAGAAYADVLIHGSGMPALQWRSRPGEDTNTFDLPFDGPGTFKIKLVRTGVKIYMYVAKGNAELKKIANTEVSFHDPVLVGLVVCAHQANASATVEFSDVSVEAQPTPAPPAH
jgi:TolB protein